MEYINDNMHLVIEYWKFIFLVILIINLSIAQIPAWIAAKKGYSYVGFLFFGLFFFLVALVVSLFIKDKLAPLPFQTVVCQQGHSEKGSLVDKLTDLKKAYESGLVNDSEYSAKKESYLKEY